MELFFKQTNLSYTHANPSSYIFKISEEQQQNELHKLKLGLREEQFFVVVDLLNFTIIDLGGVESLGFEPKTFTLKNYFDMVDPQGVMPMLTALGKQTFLFSKTDLIDFLKPSYIVLTPMILKKNDNIRYLVKRIIAPWQVTACGKITAYLTHCTLIKEYEGEALYPRIEGIPASYRAMVMNEFQKEFSQLKPKENNFEPNQRIILQHLLTEKNLAVIAGKMGLKLYTVKSYTKDILEKARKMYADDKSQHNFRTAKDVAIYMKNNGIIVPTSATEKKEPS